MLIAQVQDQVVIAYMYRLIVEGEPFVVFEVDALARCQVNSIQILVLIEAQRVLVVVVLTVVGLVLQVELFED